MPITHLLATQTTSSGLLGSLGIDWRSILLDSVAFLIIAWLGERYIYPVLSRALDTKRQELEAAERLKHTAEETLEAAKASALKILTSAHESATQTIAAADQEASQRLQRATAQANRRTERLLGEAHEQLTQDIEAARDDLKAETLRLVASAAETVVSQKLTSPEDVELITRSLELER